jgi:RecA-family ATPase
MNGIIPGKASFWENLNPDTKAKLAGHERSFNLKDDLQRLERTIKEVGNVVLIMIDPITAYLGDKIDSHQTTAVRAILEPLARFAEKHEICILAITHPPKVQQTAKISTVYFRPELTL